MSRVLAGSTGGHVEVDVDTAVAGDDDLYNGAGEATSEYNDTDDDANGTTFLKTNLGRVDQAEVSVEVNDPELSSSDVGVQVADARPAAPDDFFEDAAFIEGTILITLVDEDGSGEIDDDTDIGEDDLEFSYQAVRE